MPMITQGTEVMILAGGGSKQNGHIDYIRSKADGAHIKMGNPSAFEQSQQK